MVFFGEEKDAREIENEIIEYLLVFGFSHFNDRFPKFNGIGLVF